MRSLLRNIRSKSKGARNQYALVVSSVFTGLVAAAWFLTGMSLDSVRMENEVNIESEAPFSNLTKQMKEQWLVVKDKLALSGLTTPTSSVVGDLSSTTTEGLVDLIGTSTENVSSTTTKPLDYVIVQIATSSNIGLGTSSPATSSVLN